ncbi:hypothetical protein GOHSU_38_00330 [Gordonia hirsuta DSM 44140 = NBRC 16056]|uniref:DUF262 domain-containing protein n=1 Tax=Gordonia hirsuta DSM 44140 = NBRC 16056 TaxID=1121927 RepID=L7LBT7_9ACTN|nr:DUF262 domain-containing protein [Gordonia hirsuta]GAC58394.1 hypothetical protein GOHSU_38_00330 [Gordonia hirsuta DSM 44140 = NBRC 16056]
MKGNIRRIYSVFDGNSKQLLIPVYQRNYDWGESQCRRLYDDLVELTRTNRETHFFGAVVGNPEDSFTYVVIDGQQRLTTTSLLMLALVNSLSSGIVTSKKDPRLGPKIRSNYLELADQGQEAKFKLKPVKNDNDAYRRLLSGDEALLEDSNVTANYRYFMSRIAEGELTGDQLWDAIQRLEVMVLDLEKQDDPQRIFESLNSTGLELSEADKIRNIVLMGLPAKKQELLYENYWNRVEENVDYETDTFIRSYLISRTRKTPRRDRLYDTFRAYQKSSGRPIDDILADMRAYSEFSKQIESSNTGHAGTDQRLTRFNLMRRDVALPFLMPVLADFEEGRISGEDLHRIITIIDVYLFRRFTCEVPTHGLNKIFATLYGDVAKLVSNEAHFVDVLTYLLTRRETGSGRFPRDDEFREAFESRNFYKIPPTMRGYVFECLENTDSSDGVDIARRLEYQTLSTEHVMPRTLTNSWRNSLGSDADEIHSTWLNRIGNLTVTGYNSSYSNSSFNEKKSCENGFDATPYRLNKEMRESDSWGVEQLRTRSKRLASAALGYWPMPETDFELAVEPMPTEPMSDDGSFTGRTISAFELGSSHRTVASWAETVIQVVRELLADHRERIFALAVDESGLSLGTSSPKYFSEVVPGLHINTHNTTDARVAILRRVFAHLGLDPDDLLFVLGAKPATKEFDDADPPVGRYAEITKFVAPFSEFENTSATSEATSDIRNEFAQSARTFTVDNPQHQLDGRSVPEVMTADFIDSADDEHLLAALSLLLQVEPLMPGQVHSRLLDGSLARLLEALT